MKISKLLLSVCLLFLAVSVYAQQTMKGLVTDSKDNPIKDAEVVVDGVGPVYTDAEGLFEISLPSASGNPRNVLVKKEGYEVLDWGMSRKVGGLRIVLGELPVLLNGKVVNLEGTPVAGVIVKMGGLRFKDKQTTDANGKFTLELPFNTKVSKNSRFLVNETVVSGDYVLYNETNTSITLRIDTVINIAANETETPTTPVEPTTTEESSEVEAEQPPAEEDLFPEDDEIYIPPTLIVVVYDQDITPAESVEVFVDKEKYMTDARGEFQVYTDSISDSDFEVPDYEITKKFYDYADNYMFIHIRKPGEENIMDIPADSISYDENFNFVFNQLESEKQVLQQNGQQLRKEITKINTKLDRTNEVTAAQRRRLQAHLKRLEEALVENEVAYEDAQYKTREMLDRMKGQILQQVEQIEIIEEEKELFRKELILSLVLGGILLIAVIALFFTARKIRKQHDELEIAHNDLKQAKEKIELQRDQMMAVRDIGQEFTAKLELNKHMLELKKLMQAFFDVHFFGIGILNELTRELEFQKPVREGNFVENFSYPIKDNNRLAVWCFNNRKPIIINDLSKEYHNYLEGQPRFEAEETPNSLIYLPLIVENETLGVMTVHSNQINAYKDLDSSVIKTLGSYASIAVSNSHSFDIIRQKNRNITDSIRYAETIQQAILPSKERMDSFLNDTFIMYRSKDIVSGDFYWFSEVATEDDTQMAFLAVVDCTGHGVPGAFMSMIGHTLLNEIINQIGVRETDTILYELDERVRAALQQEKNTQSDGMDVCLCRFTKKPTGEVEVQFTGAKRPLMYIDESGKIETISGDSKSIASVYHADKKFSAHTMQLPKDTMMYMTTDGYIDQNNKQRERFGTTNLKRLFEDIHTKALTEQAEILVKTLVEHQQDEEQRDDITIVGIRI